MRPIITLPILLTGLLTGLLTASLSLLATAPVGAEEIQTGAAGTAGIVATHQNASGVDLRLAVDRFGLEAVALENETAQKVTMPRVFLPNDAGAPDLPGLSRMVALPEGATVTYEIIRSERQVYSDVSIAPAPVIPREDDDSPLVYEKNPAIFERDAHYPTSPVMVSDVLQVRGVDAVMVGITPFQYNPVTKELVVYTEIEIRLSFQGGTGVFGEERLRSRYWEPILANHLINYESLPAIDFNGAPDRDRYGWEYVIISPSDPGFVAWADTLATWRNLQGISTQVFTTDETGTSWSAIETFLNNAYNTWETPPAAFLLLGDYPGSGDDYGITSPIWSGYCVSDNIYADVDNNDLPDMAHGRITGRTADEIGHMITKMLDYEREPYTDPGFYDHPVIAGGWQTERWFIFCTEIVWGFQNIVLGKEPVREYAIYSGVPGSVWSSNQNTNIVLNYFGPSGLGYIPQTPEHLNDWGSNATRMNNALNAGAYMLLHRDHGGVTGWGEPDYDIGDLSGLNNEMYPFVFSINCLTGMYNSSSECFTERFHRMDHGALGVIAASETSYSFVNDTFIWGMFDGLWHDFMPDYGPFQVDHDFRLPAFGMASGKYFLQSSSWPYNPSNKDETHHLFHHHGDTFLTMYTEVPQPLTVQREEVLFIGLDSYTMTADEGALISLTVNGEIIGVATATGLPQDIAIIPQELPGELTITVTKPEYFRHVDTVPILPPEGPYLVFGSSLIDDADGDADGVLDEGETVGIEVMLENVGVEGTTGVTGTLTTTDEYITILTAEQAFPDIPSGGEGSCLEPFELYVAGNVPDGHVATFTLQTTSTEGSWDCSFALPIQAPVVIAGQAFIDDSAPGGNGDGGADPAEMFTIMLALSNAGQSDCGAVQGTLGTLSPFVTILDDEATCLGIPADGEGMLSAFKVALSMGSPNNTWIAFTVELTGEEGFTATIPFTINVGAWVDHAETDMGWSLGVPGDNASTGIWVREEPVGTTYSGYTIQPDFDHTPDPGEICFITGNTSVGGGAGDNDVDGGKTTLMTPVFGLAGATEATISYWRWYSNSWGGAPDNDWWDVEVTANGIDWVSLEHTMQTEAEWVQRTFDLTEYIEPSAQVQIRFIAADEGEGSLVEAGVDDFMLSASFPPASDAGNEAIGQQFGLLFSGPNPVGPDTRIVYQLGHATQVDLALYDISGRMVRSLVQGTVEGGTHTISFDGRSQTGHPLANGIYFLRFSTPEVMQVKQITVLH